MGAHCQLLLVAATVLSVAPTLNAAQKSSVPLFATLVFSKTTGFRHSSIAEGVAAIKALGAEHGFEVDAMEDAARFTDTALSHYKVVVFLSTTGAVLDAAQKVAFERYIGSGGGFVGILISRRTLHLFRAEATDQWRHATAAA